MTAALRAGKGKRKSLPPLPAVSPGLSAGDCAHRLMHRHSTADNYATALRSFACVSWQKDISFAEVDSRLVDAYGNGSGKRDMQGHLVLLHALFACCLQQGGGAGAYGAERTFRQCVYGHFPHPETFDRKADINKLRAVQVKPGSFMQLVRDVFLVLLLCLRHAFCGCGFPEEIADKGWHA